MICIGNIYIKDQITISSSDTIDGTEEFVVTKNKSSDCSFPKIFYTHILFYKHVTVSAAVLNIDDISNTTKQN